MGTSKKTFVTLFVHTKNIHLTKDVGMIPYCMAKNHGYDSKIVTIKEGTYQNHKKYTPEIKLEFIEGDFLRTYPA